VRATRGFLPSEDPYAHLLAGGAGVLHAEVTSPLLVARSSNHAAFGAGLPDCGLSGAASSLQYATYRMDDDRLAADGQLEKGL
jgi:hypothetical protein